MADLLNAEAMEEYVVTHLPSLIYALVILVVGFLVARIAKSILRRVLLRTRLDATLCSFLSNLGYMLLLTVVVIATLEKLGIDTTSLAAVVAAAGLAIGLALQGSLSNFASGVMIIGFRPFRVGDYVEVGGTEGIVEDVSVLFTQMRTGDNKLIIVPNSEITGDVITNYSAKDTRRIDLVVGVGYDDDLKTTREVLERVLSEEERVLGEPESTIAVSELADSSVNFVVRPWVQTEDYWPVRFELTERIKLELDAAGINIPYPQRDLHLHQAA